jgi:hypothetical protein
MAVARAGRGVREREREREVELIAGRASNLNAPFRISHLS